MGLLRIVRIVLASYNAHSVKVRKTHNNQCYQWRYVVCSISSVIIEQVSRGDLIWNEASH